MKTPAQRLASWMRSARMNQTTLAGELGCSQGYLSHVLGEDKIPGLRVAIAIRDVMRAHGARGIAVESWATAVRKQAA